METRILIPKQLKIVFSKEYEYCNKNKHSFVSSSNEAKNPVTASNLQEKDETPSSSSSPPYSKYKHQERQQLFLDSESPRNSECEQTTIASENLRNKRKRSPSTIKRHHNNNIIQSDSSDSDSFTGSFHNRTDTESEDNNTDVNSVSDQDNDDDECVSSAQQQLSKVIKKQKGHKKSRSDSIKIVARHKILKGTILNPNEGDMKAYALLRRQENSLPEQNDIRFMFGCFDRLMDDPLKFGQKIHFCNWLVFVKRIANFSNPDLNMIGKFMDRRPVLETTKDLVPGQELLVYFDVESIKRDLREPIITKSLDLGEAPLDLSKPLSPPSLQVPKRSASVATTILDNYEKEKSSSPSPPPSPTSSNDDDHKIDSNRARCYQQTSLFQPYLYTNNTNSSQKSNHEPLILTPPLSSSNTHNSNTNAPLSSPTDSNNSTLNSPNSISFIPKYPTIQGPSSSINEHARRMHLFGLNHYERNTNNNNNNNSTTGNSLLRPILRTRGRERSLLPCEVCNKAFDRPSLLKRHMRTHTGEKPHVCDTCGKGFSTSSSLNTHRRIHSGEKPHQCPICGKRFTASSNLYYHRMTHNKEKPHKCLLCGKSFPTPGDLKSHQYVHSGSWPFSCRICNRGFSKQTNLRNHLLLHSGDKPHNCRICNKKFALACNLRAHLRTHEEESATSSTTTISCISCKRTYITALNMVIDGKCHACTLKHSSSSTEQLNDDANILKITNNAVDSSSDISTIPQPYPNTTTMAESQQSQHHLMSLSLNQNSLLINPTKLGLESSSFHHSFPLNHHHHHRHSFQHLQQQLPHLPSTAASLAATVAAIHQQQQQQQATSNHSSPFLHSMITNDHLFGNSTTAGRSNPFLEQLFEWNWRVAKETAGNLGLMQQKLLESQILAAQLMSSSPSHNSAAAIANSTSGISEFLQLQQIQRARVSSLGKISGSIGREILGNKGSNNVVDPMLRESSQL